MRIFYSIFLIIFLSPIIIFARPDLKIGISGNDIYGTSDNATGAEYTIYNTLCGKYSYLQITMENDKNLDNTTDTEIYKISVTKPSSDWDYYVVYHTQKYTGDWNTEWINSLTSDSFLLYVRPPDGVSAETSTFVVNISDSKGSKDAGSVYVNVKKESVFDIMLPLSDNSTIGEYTFEDNDESEYYLYVDSSSKYYLDFTVKNRGNKLAPYNITVSSSKLPESAFTVYKDGTSQKLISPFGNNIFYLDKNGEDKYSFEIDASKIDSSDYFYVKILDTSANLLDTFKVNVAYLAESKVKQRLPYIKYNDTKTTPLLFIVNTSDVSGDVSVENLVDDSSSKYSLDPKATNIITLTKDSKLTVSSENIDIAAFIVVLDSDYKISANITPSNSSIEGKKVVLPLVVKGGTLGGTGSISINNISTEKNSVSVKLYDTTGKKVAESALSINQESYSYLDISLLSGNSSSSELYWIEFTATYDISVYLVNSVLGSYLKFYGYSIDKK